VEAGGKNDLVPDSREGVNSPAAVAVPPADARLAALWNAYHGDVLSYALRRASPDVAADVTAAVFGVLWRRIDEPLDDPLPWLYAVARRELANHRRSDRRRGALLARLSLRRGVPTTAPDPAERAVEGAVARAALVRLRPADREVLMLVAWEGLDPARAAAALGITEAAFAVRLHRARHRLEAQLSREEHR
jgi:RNA polymerase sigma-70 factor (ECF subfamily)